MVFHYQYHSLSTKCNLIAFVLEINCPLLPVLEYGETRPSEVSSIVESVISYRCFRGYEFPNGKREHALRCEASGEWDGEFMQCQGGLT